MCGISGIDINPIHFSDVPIDINPLIILSFSVAHGPLKPGMLFNIGSVVRMVT